MTTLVLSSPEAFEFKFSDDDDQEGRIKGYGAVFNLMDLGGDIILPGAFKHSLKEWKAKKRPVPMLWHHDMSNPIGTWDELAEDDKGLQISGKLTKGVPQAGIARALIKDRAVTGLSIGFRTKEAEIDRTTGARRLKKLDLWEISAVTAPMMPDAQISGIKNTQGFDPNSWEQAFRDEGLSNRESKLATSVARKLLHRDGGVNEPTRREGARSVLLEMRKFTELLRS